ncbi:MAG: FAD-binding protein [Gammaproteobacteria bacterium]|nr:FAD-binding protein [Gammaproteobacteria bacterium]MDH5799749.1 FAD-binding protein [Gammaproteobacteria bacterium]
MSLFDRLKAIVPAHSVLTTEEQLRPYECDGLTAYKQLPLVVVLPETVEQVQQIMQLCCQMQVPVVARGAGTGLSGGALPLQDSLVLSLARFNKILDVDYANRLARVQPGVRNLAISQAVEAMGLFYAPDPSSQIACTIGGNVAENSGGVHCLKYGLTVHNIAEIKIVTMEGELLTIGATAPDAPGFDLLALFTGSEGLLGVIVEVVVKLVPKPQHVQVMLIAFDRLENAAQMVSDVIAAGVVPAGLEMMDKAAIKAAEAFVHAGYPLDAEAILLCELDGSSVEVSEQVNVVQELANARGATKIVVAENDKQRELLWKGRKAAFPAVGRLSPDYYCMDGTIPRRHLPQVLQTIAQLSEEYKLPVANVFHAGDGNLHPLILYDANKPGELERTEEFGARILEACVAVGGTITGEHGVGKEKIDQMCLQFQPLELETFHAVKAVFDEQGLLNPGKAVPTLHRCAELGRMHIHGGELPFPDLERF